ncbi:MAG: magnesium transporter CorA family protein [Patescibacteria group bacterium]
MAIKIIKFNNLRWINIDNFDDVAAKFLKNNFKFHHLDIQDCAQDNPHPKVDMYKKYLFAVFNFPELGADNIRIDSNELDVFIGENFLVTIQKKKFKFLKTIFYRCVRSSNIKEEFFNSSSGFLLYKILHNLYGSTTAINNYFSTQISELEKTIYDKYPENTTVTKLAGVRRDILKAISILEPQRYTINTLVHARQNFLPEELNIYFDDVHDLIESVWIILKNYDDIISGLQTTTESLISNKTNEVVKILTTISVALMPLTLLSGIYGMNIDLLPGAHKPLFVWLIFIVLSTITLSTLLYLRKKNWL